LPSLVVAIIGLGGTSVWALATTEWPYNGGLESADSPVVAWLRDAGLNPATHVLLGGLVVAVCAVVWRSATHGARTTTDSEM
jgi:hypothetical protein